MSWLKRTASPERNSPQEYANPGLQKDNETPATEIYPRVQKGHTPVKPERYPSVVKAELPGMPSAKAPGAMPGMGGPKSEAVTVDSVIKSLKSLISSEKSLGGDKDAKKLETALSALEAYKGKPEEKKDVEKDDKE